jgi:hypothetical protein
MCVVSNVGDWYQQQPWVQPWVQEPFKIVLGEVTRLEFDALKAKVEEMIDLLKKAKEIDDKTGQPDCDQDEKIVLLKRIAKEFGYDLDFLGGNNAKVTASPALGACGSGSCDCPA